MSNELTKLDVARRQLAVAIRLFFDNRDPVSIYTLAGNAWEIIDALCKLRDVDSLSRQTKDHLPIDIELKKHVINPWRNFFKHADRDPEEQLQGFSDDLNDHLLMLAGEDLLRLEPRKLVECQIFQVWYLAVYEEKIATEDLERVLPKIRTALPNIRYLPRVQQKHMGQKWLRESSNDQGLLTDPRTNASELHRWDTDQT